MSSNEDDKPKLAYEPQPARMSPEGWIVLEWRQRGETIDWFPYRCCECLAADHLRILWPRFRPSMVRIKIPICRECLSRWQRRQRTVLLWGMALMMAFLLLSWLLFLRKFGWEEQAYAASSFVAVGAVATLLIREFTGSPIEVATAPRGQRRITMRFRNRAFWVYLAECDQLKP